MKPRYRIKSDGRIEKIKELKVAFGADCPEIGFSQQKWQEHYGPNGYEDKELKRKFADDMNRARAANGLPPI